MSQILDVKLVHETNSGSLIRSPAKIEIKDGRIWFVKSPFALRHEIKAMAGSRWHGFDPDEPKKIWSVKDCPRNRFQLGYLMGEDVYEWFDRDLIRHDYRDYERDGVKADPMPHQFDMADAGLTYHYTIWGAEMGCVDGDAIVHVNRCGRGFKMKLKDLHHKFHGGTTRGRAWDPAFPTYVRSLKRNTFGQHLLRNVLCQGVKPVVRVTLTNGQSIRVTPDHEFFDPGLNLVRADGLRKGWQIIVSGLLNDVELWDAHTCNNTTEYVVVPCRDHPRAGRRGTIHEHVLVMEQHLKRHLAPKEVVHHINGRKNDNRIENLQLMLDTEHKSFHASQSMFANMSGGRDRVDFAPTLGVVSHIESDGEAEVFDLVMADPYRNFIANGFLVKNCGKTLSAQMVIEKSGVDWWYWVGPARSLPNMEREFRLWGFDHSKIRVDFMSYERLKRVVDEWHPGDPLPQGVILDESSRCKNHTSQRSQAAQILADRIRNQYHFDGYVIEMSGTPSPKKPINWWSQCEIAWPGFLREGSVKALEQRLAFMVKQEFDSGTHWQTIGWKDDERKCDVCGEMEDHPCHTLDNFMGEVGEGSDDEYHKFVPSKNEVAYMYERLKGLVVIKHKKDCLNLPDKRYRRVLCRAKSSVLRVAKALVDSAPNAVTGMTLLRELSDGFQYREEPDGKVPCNHCPGACGKVDEWFDPTDERRTFSNVDMLDADLVERLEKRTVKCPKCKGTGEVTKMRRFAREVPCPKEQALRDLLEENEETGRLVVFAGFTGSVDRCCKICRKEGWSVVRCDGRGYQVTLADGSTVTGVEALDYWADLENNPRVAFVAHPESGGMSLTLTEARMAVYWSNSFKPEYRTQSEDRIHRKGMDENLGCTIVDLIHLSTDDRVLEIIRENRKLELMTMGEVMQDITFEEEKDGSTKP